MRDYIIRRIIIVIPLLLAIFLMSFLIMQLFPGSYLDQMRLSPDISKDLIKELEAVFGLDQNIIMQYLSWLGQILQGNLGESFTYSSNKNFKENFFHPPTKIKYGWAEYEINENKKTQSAVFSSG